MSAAGFKPCHRILTADRRPRRPGALPFWKYSTSNTPAKGFKTFVPTFFLWALPTLQGKEAEANQWEPHSTFLLNIDFCAFSICLFASFLPVRRSSSGRFPGAAYTGPPGRAGCGCRDAQLGGAYTESWMFLLTCTHIPIFLSC